MMLFAQWKMHYWWLVTWLDLTTTPPFFQRLPQERTKLIGSPPFFQRLPQVQRLPQERTTQRLPQERTQRLPQEQSRLKQRPPRLHFLNDRLVWLCFVSLFVLVAHLEFSKCLTYEDKVPYRSSAQMSCREVVAAQETGKIYEFFLNSKSDAIDLWSMGIQGN
jgi:hypothetical protein